MNLRRRLLVAAAASLGLAKNQRVWLKPRQVKVFAVPSEALEEGGSGI